jgi:hypothetical protein
MDISFLNIRFATGSPISAMDIVDGTWKYSRSIIKGRTRNEDKL